MRGVFLPMVYGASIFGIWSPNLPVAGQGLFPPIAPIFPAPLSILADPRSQTAKTGESVTFTVVASGGGNLSYQWQLNGTNITGAINSFYFIPYAQTNNAGDYSVTVSSSQSSAVSLPATLRVLPLSEEMRVLVQPSSQAVVVGSSAIFVAVSTTSTPLTYQWQRDGVPIPGATAPSLVLPAVQRADVGQYTVVGSDGADSIVSDPANLSVLVSSPISPVLSDPQVRGSRFVFNATVDLNRNYRIQTSTDLNIWVDIGNFFSSNSRAFLEESFSLDEPTQFYRIISR